MKNYKCVWCGTPIFKAERYVKNVLIYEGDFQSQKWHTDCFEVSREYFKKTKEDGFDPGSFKRGSLEER